MKSKYIFNFDKFSDSVENLDKTKQLDEAEKEGHRIVSTIADYTDCAAEFIMGLTEEGLGEAFRMADIENNNLLQSIASATRVNSLAQNTGSLRRSRKEDLF